MTIELTLACRCTALVQLKIVQVPRFLFLFDSYHNPDD